MKRLAAVVLLALLSPGAAQETAPAAENDPLVMQRRLAMVLRQSTQHYEAEEYQTALGLLESLEGPAGQDLSVLNLRGAILTKLGRHDEAVALFQSILATNPGYFPAAFNLGEVESIRGNHAGALELFQGMRRRDPRNELVRFKVFLCQLVLDRDDEAQKMARGFIPAGSTPAWYYAQAMLARKAGDEATANDHLATARAIYLDGGCRLFDESVATVNF